MLFFHFFLVEDDVLDWFDRLQIFDDSRDLAQSVFFNLFITLLGTVSLDFLLIFVLLNVEQDRIIFANEEDLKLADFDGTFDELFLFLAKLLTVIINQVHYLFFKILAS